MVQEALAPRAARNTKSYAETIQPDTSNKRKKRVQEPRERPQRRSTRASDSLAHSLPMIEGASAQVRGWSFGNLTKKDASHFVRAVCTVSFYMFFSIIIHFPIVAYSASTIISHL